VSESARTKDEKQGLVSETKDGWQSYMLHIYAVEQRMS